ncbi:MAG: hypothetical protein JST68_03040 [Bacteroidetes bacterium]|nr:hypothetical protein [Bacteroidota bacterium]
MKDFIDRYYSPVFSAISRLTRISSRQELETLTQNVLYDLWQQKETFLADSRQGVFIYKTILRHVFTYLKHQGDDKRIDFLKNTLPIDPDFYNQMLS